MKILPSLANLNHYILINKENTVNLGLGDVRSQVRILLLRPIQ